MGEPKQIGLNIRGKADQSYDAIVVGSGISGGWAAKELCEKGLRTLVLERGRNVEHLKDYTSAMLRPWEFRHRLNIPQKQKILNPLKAGAADEGSEHFFVDDSEHPYIQETPFNWVRGYQVGGRSLTWGRQCYRYSDLDFEANIREGIGIDWPIRYKDLAPWYDYVESFVGISGQKEGLNHLPDGQFLPPMEMNCIEEYFSGKIRNLFSDRIVTIGRVANLTRGWQGRGPCQFRNLCSRGCPFGGYFSSNSATLPVAAATGNLTLKSDAIVIEVLYDSNKRKAKGVRVMDSNTMEVTEYFARIIFLNASTIPTTALLLNSALDQFPDGLGNSSGQLGHHLMDHFTGTGAEAEYDGFRDKYYFGRRPVGIYMPRFRNISPATSRKEFTRGFGIQGMGGRDGWGIQMNVHSGFGVKFKEKLLQPGSWGIWLGGWGETLPYYDNKITLDNKQKDKWGLSLVKIKYAYGENEKDMSKDILISIEEMLEKTGFNIKNSYSHLHPGGSAVHEMGTARMGKDIKTSVLNSFNQLHDAMNVFVTDGSCMTSSGTANPSLTYMAITARACDFAVSEMRKGNL